MAIILGGTTLNPNMVWDERYSYAPVIQTVQTTLGGTPIVYTQSIAAGMPITLTAYQDQGWLTKAMADAVQMNALIAGTVLALVLGADTYQVMFRHQDAPAVTLQPLLPRAIPLDGDYFVGQIKLMTV